MNNTVRLSSGLISFLLIILLTACSSSSSSDGGDPPPPPPPPPDPPAMQLFVSSRNTNSVERFDAETGAFFDTFVSDGANGLNATQEVAIGPDGNLYVSGRGNGGIMKFDIETGDFIENFTSGFILDEPTKMTFKPGGDLYVSQWGGNLNKVARFNSNTGEFIDEITKTDIDRPMGHAWDDQDNLYVASFGSRNVQKFDSDGNFVEIFTSGGSLTGVVNIWFDDAGDLFAVDWETGSVQQFDGSDGTFIRTFIQGLTRVEGFAFGPNGDLYLCDWQDNIIKRYNPDTGQEIETFITGGGLAQPNSLVFKPSN